MANIKSQIKRNKQNEKARMRNKAVKSELRTSVRKFREAADAGNAEAAVTATAAAVATLPTPIFTISTLPTDIRFFTQRITQLT